MRSGLTRVACVTGRVEGGGGEERGEGEGGEGEGEGEEGVERAGALG